MHCASSKFVLHIRHLGAGDRCQPGTDGFLLQLLCKFKSAGWPMSAGQFVPCRRPPLRTGCPLAGSAFGWMSFSWMAPKRGPWPQKKLVSIEMFAKLRTDEDIHPQSSRAPWCVFIVRLTRVGWLQVLSSTVIFAYRHMSGRNGS